MRAGRHIVNIGLAAAASASAALPLFRGGPGALETVAALGAALAAGGLAWRSRDRVAVEPAPAEAERGAGPDAALKPLLQGVLPVWRRHVASVKGQTEEAVNRLAQSFASITEQFEAAGFRGTNAASVDDDASTMSLLTLCERELQPVVASMRQILNSKGALAASVHDLSRATTELQGMASGVSHIAAQTNMLAINAAIEAARVGEAGRGFAVIAKEIRALSQESAQTGKLITERMAEVSKIMQITVHNAENASAHDQSAIDLSGSVIEDVLSHVRELNNSADGMRTQGDVIRSEIDSLMVDLQFQDRVSQLIMVIDADIDRLEGELGQPRTLPRAEVWLADLERCYTMPEQRLPAAGIAAVPVPVAAQAIFF